MTKQLERWQQFYQCSKEITHRPNTELAVAQHKSDIKVAIDCGCGTGADTAYLSSHGYTVHAFDINEDAIAICKERFCADTNIHLTVSDFETYTYPTAGIVIANSSLFFADVQRFMQTWQLITQSLSTGGVFTGNFLGQKDDWANGFEIPTNPMTQKQVQALFTEFEVLNFSERDEIGHTLQGERKHWHVFFVLAIKKINQSEESAMF